MKRLIECVPNFSEGRDPAKVDAIVQAMSNVTVARFENRVTGATEKLRCQFAHSSFILDDENGGHAQAFPGQVRDRRQRAIRPEGP